MRTDTEATVELWQEQAMHNLQAAEDFKLELADARREMCELEKQLAAERALADRLAGAANAVIDQWDTPNWKLTETTATYMNTLRNTINAWKEVRDGSR